MRDKFIVMNTAIITSGVALLLGIIIVGSFESDKRNIEVRKAKVTACSTIADPAARTLCLKGA